MTYPDTITLYPDRVDKNASGWYISGEYFNIPSSSPYQMYLDHVPEDESTTEIWASGGAEWTEDFTGTPAAGEFYVEYDVGRVTFNSANADAAMEARYDTLGDDIMAEHVNNMQNETYGVELELGQGIPGVYTNLAERLDNFITVGSPVSATQVSISTPPGLTATTVQQFIDTSGTANRSDTNPFGIGWNDIYDADGDMIRAQNNITIGYLFANTVSASGTQLGMNVDGPDEDQWMYFYDTGSPTGQHIKWNDALSRFEFSTDLWVNGTVAGGASGVMWNRTGSDTIWPIYDGDDVGINGGLTASGVITAELGIVAGDDIVPDASGTVDLGSQANTFNETYAETSHADDFFETNASGVFCWGDPSTNGTWRITTLGDDLVIQRREASTWVTKSTVLA